MTPDQRPCLCTGRYICHRCTVACKWLRDRGRRGVTDEVWLNELHRLIPGFIDRLLEGAA